MIEVNQPGRHRGYNFPALKDVQLNLGPVALPLHRVIAGFQLLPAYGHGIGNLQRALVSRQCACRQQQSQSQRQALKHFRYFHATPFSFPKNVGNRFWAAWTRSGGKTCVSPPKPYNAASGLREKNPAARPGALCSRTVLSSAAKPKVSQSLLPL